MLVSSTGVAQTFNATYHCTNFVSQPAAITRVLLTPYIPFADYPGATLNDSPIPGKTDTNGNVTFSNLFAGYSYVFELDTVFKKVLRTNGFPTGLTGTVAAENYSGVWLPGQRIFAYLSTNLVGNVTNGGASGPLSGQVTGPLNNTVVSSVGSAPLPSTNLVGYIQSLSVYQTNSANNALQIWVKGATTNAINGLYTQDMTNSGSHVATWTNAGTSYFIYLNDPNIGPGLFIEHNPGGQLLYDTAYPPFQTWDNADGTGTVTSTFGTNYTTNVFQVLAYSNYVFAASSYQSNVVVDPIMGNDTLATLTNFPYKTFHAAIQSTNLNGAGTITLAAGFYTETGTVSLPTNVMVNGNGAVFTAANFVLNANSGCTVQDITITNGNLSVPSTFCTNVVFKNIYAHGSIDGLYFFNLGTVDCYNCDFGGSGGGAGFNGGWDGIAVFGSTNWSRLRLFNCSSTCNQGNTLNATGMHSLIWNPNRGGKLQIFGGSYTIINPTNVAYSGVTIQGNASLMIGGINGDTVFSNASVEIYGASFNHGTTNVGAQAPAIYNAAGIPIQGTWYDNTNATTQYGSNNLSVLVVTNNLVVGGTISGNGAGLTNVQANSDGYGGQSNVSGGTNFTIFLGTNGATAPKKVYIALTNNFVANLITNGPGSVAYYLTCLGATNHDIYVPWNQAGAGGISYFYNSNWIASASGSNAVLHLTNGHQAILYFDGGTNFNPLWTNVTIIPNLQ